MGQHRLGGRGSEMTHRMGHRSDRLGIANGVFAKVGRLPAIPRCLRQTADPLDIPFGKLIEAKDSPKVG